MDDLAWIEEKADRVFASARDAYDLLHERAHKLAVVLAGGGGAAIVLALRPDGDETWQLVGAGGIAAMALFWYAVLLRLLLAMRTGATSTGPEPWALLQFQDWERTQPEPGSAQERARRKALEVLQESTLAVRAQTAARADALDRAYARLASGTLAIATCTVVACALVWALGA